MTALDQALRLCERFPTFPCRADKKPACQHGFKDASREPTAIVDLWRRYPGPLIGVPTGSVSGIDALDIDPRHGGNAWLAEAIESLPVTQTNHTQSGGRHFLFAHVDPVKNTTSAIAPGVDTRGNGGYIIWWPAAGCGIENDGTVDDWPRWLLRILCPPKRKYAPPPAPATSEEASTRALLMIERAYNRVRDARPGQRHYELRAAAATLSGLSRFLTKGQADIEDELVTLAMCAGGEDKEGAYKTAKWAMDKGRSQPLLVGR